MSKRNNQIANRISSEEYKQPSHFTKRTTRILSSLCNIKFLFVTMFKVIPKDKNTNF